MTISEIARLARAAGMSYGEYAQAHAAELAEREKEDVKRRGAKPCAVCGKLFVPPNSRYKYCSDTCSMEARLKRNLEYWHKNHDEDKFCAICGKQIYHGKNKYCSPPCRIAGNARVKMAYREKKRRERAARNAATDDDISGSQGGAS